MSEETMQETRDMPEPTQESGEISQFLANQNDYLEVGIHIATKVKSAGMKRFIYKVREDGLYLLDLKTIDAKIAVAAKMLAMYDPKDVVVTASRIYAIVAAEKFASIIGAKFIKGRVTPGIFTNPHRDDYMEAKLILIIAVLFSVLAYLYSERLKDMLLVGNIYVAFTYAIPFIYGNFVVAAALSVNILLISLSIFLIGLAREIYGMIRDKEGDIAARKTKNLISCIGERRSAEFGLILTVEGIIISMYLFIYQTPFKFNLAFMLPITLANLLIFYIGVGHISHANSGSRKWFDRARNLSFVGMGIALLAYLLTGLGLYLII